MVSLTLNRSLIIYLKEIKTLGRKSEWFIMEFSNSSFVDLVNLPFEEKTVILYKNKKTSIIHQFKYKVKKSINRRGEK